MCQLWFDMSYVSYGLTRVLRFMYVVAGAWMSIAKRKPHL